MSDEPNANLDTIPDDYDSGAAEDGTLDIDFTGVEETRVIPEGVYPARVQDAEIKNSASSSQPTLYLKLELLGPEKYVGRTLFYTVSLQATARGLLQTALVGLGFPKDDLRAKIRLNPAALLERVCGVRVTVQTYDGDLTNRVNKLVPIGKVPAELMAAPEAPFGDITTADADSDKPSIF
jgi:hypothetical protein